MIQITKITSIDETAYSHVKCPQCNSKIGWKPKGSKVHIFHLSRKAEGKFGSMIVSCWRCKNNYLIDMVIDD